MLPCPAFNDTLLYCMCIQRVAVCRSFRVRPCDNILYRKLYEYVQPRADTTQDTEQLCGKIIYSKPFSSCTRIFSSLQSLVPVPLL